MYIVERMVLFHQCFRRTFSSSRHVQSIIMEISCMPMSSSSWKGPHSMLNEFSSLQLAYYTNNYRLVQVGSTIAETCMTQWEAPRWMWFFWRTSSLWEYSKGLSCAIMGKSKLVSIKQHAAVHFNFVYGGLGRTTFQHTMLTWKSAKITLQVVIVLLTHLTHFLWTVWSPCWTLSELLECIFLPHFCTHSASHTGRSSNLFQAVQYVSYPPLTFCALSQSSPLY